MDSNHGLICGRGDAEGATVFEWTVFWRRVRGGFKLEHGYTSDCIALWTRLCSVCVYLKYERVPASGSGGKRAKYGFGSETRGGASWLCLALPFVSEPKSCFARLCQSPEPDVKNLI